MSTINEHFYGPIFYNYGFLKDLQLSQMSTFKGIINQNHAYFPEKMPNLIKTGPKKGNYRTKTKVR